MATARLGHADLLPWDHDAARHAIDLIGSGSRRTDTGDAVLRSLNFPRIICLAAAAGRVNHFSPLNQLGW
jgi:hypothetical protein